ncbi:MAG: hypothetical protein FWE50_03990 [Alphaproteobacteria bacterium]|nr:hypothetical protein [Alphaproteobacteria bacterium]
MNILCKYCANWICPYNHQCEITASAFTSANLDKKVAKILAEKNNLYMPVDVPKQTPTNHIIFNWHHQQLKCKHKEG